MVSSHDFVMAKAQAICDQRGLPYPPELIEHLQYHHHREEQNHG